MREACRICGRELCGNQRRWIFHTTAKLNLQVLLSHVLGKEVSRDGKAEFACSKCAFMLERIYRFDTVIARIEALSIERLQKLLLEKDRLKLCIAGMYKKNNDDDSVVDEAGDVASLPDVRYSALLQEDFAYSGFECWTDPEERVVEPHTCHAADSAGSRPRRCRGCAVLRVADADYEAICKIPRKVARNVSSQCSTSTCNEESPACESITADLSSSGKAPLDEESMEEETPGSSLESLDTTVAASPAHQKVEDTDTDAKRSGKCDCCTGALSLHGNRLDIALSLVKAFDCKPIQSPRGSKLPIPVKSSSLCQDLMDKNTYSAFPNAAVKSHPGYALAFPLEMSDLQVLWEDLCVDYMPLRVKNLCEDQQQLTHCDLSPGKQATELNKTELLEKIRCFDATNKHLQEKLNEMDFELKSVQHTSQRQDHKIQNLKETLKSKENESNELYHVIEGQNETIAKLQDMLHRSQLGQLQISEGSSTLQEKQQIALLDLQDTLFCTQLEVQQLKRAQQQKERQLAEARRTAQFLETMLQEEQQQKEAAWQHNKELRATLQQLKTELQNNHWQCCTLEMENWAKMQRQEQKIKHLNHNLAWNEQLLQESKELLQHHQNLDRSPTSADKMVQKLQQRIKDRDAALERALDEKFCALEDREQERQQLCLSVKERERDLEGLRRVLSSNQATIQGLESLLKAKGLELEQLLATYQNLKWLKEETEAKSHRWQTEQERTVQQLHAALYDRNKEVEVYSCKLGAGQRNIVEELCFRLQQKEQIIKEFLTDKSRLAVEQVAELQELLQAVSCREQQRHIYSANMAQALLERSCELQVLRQQLMGHTLQQKADTSTAQLIKNDEALEATKQESSGKNTTTMISKKGDIRSRMEKGVLETTAGLEKELINAKEELELLTRKERESRLELSALQSVVASQEEELQVQASDVESLTRNIQIKDELIKDLQMQLVDPEEMPAFERLTQEVLMLQEKVARVELQGQEDMGNRRLQLLLVLERLATEKEQLNETLRAEKQLYSTLVKFHAHSDSSQQEQTLHLEEVQALHGQLEEALGRSLELLSRLESLDGIGGLSVAEDAEDASTEFTDSIEEEAQRVTHQQNIKGGADDSLVGRSSCPALLSVVRGNSPQLELLSAKSEIQQTLEQKKKLEGELQDLKGQIEEAGFSSVSQLRKALLSLCLENAELKEQVGEAMLSESWENEDEKEDEDLRLEVRKLQEKLHTSEVVIGLLKEQLTLNSQGGEGTFSSQFTAQEMAKQGTREGVLHDNLPQWHFPPPRHVDSSSSHSPKGIQMGGSKIANVFWQQPHSELPQCRQPCHKLRDKLLVPEATIQAQMAQLDQYQALCTGEPMVQQDNKKIQVDLQDLGYETCGRSENEADREEATSPECEYHDEEIMSWKKLLGSLPSRLVKHETLLDFSQCDDDDAILRQHIQALQVQLQSSHRIIQNLQSHVCPISTASNYASGGEHSLKLKQDYTMGSSPSQSMTDDDEGWHSDSLGSFAPPNLQRNKALARLIQRVSHLEAHLGEAKPKLILPEELKPTASMGKYDSLVQAQARELSHLRQMMREGQGVCRILSHHFRDTIKSFEELLRGTDVDYYLGQNVREQLAQGNQLAGRLARKMNTRTDLNMEDKSSNELLVLRLSKELREKEQIIKTLQAKLQLHSATPSSSHTMSESPRSGSSTSFLSDGLESCSDTDDGNEYIFQEDPSEGQFHSLLGKDLGSHSGKASAQLSHPTSATTSPAAALVESLQGNLPLPSSSQHPLQMTSQTSRGFCSDSLSKPASFPLAPFDSEPHFFTPLGPPPPALAPLLGCCRTPVFSLAKAQQELQMLQKQLGESVKLPAPSSIKPGPLDGLLPAGSPAISKHCLQACHHAPRLLPLQNSSEWKMKSEGGVGESRTPWYMPSPRQPQAQLIAGVLPSSSPAVLSRQKVLATDLLEEHLSEIRILRQRLEESICTNDCLREQLETRLTSMAKNNGTLKQDDLVLVDDGNKQRAHVTGHLRDYSTHKKQSLESKSLIHKMTSLLQPCLEPEGSKEQSIKEEIQVLRAKLAEQENHLQRASHVKRSMEDFLLTHLTRTYDVLRKARTNLEGMSQQPTLLSAIM